jgi:pyrimidine-specific ribonucleoside hydrolase
VKKILTLGLLILLLCTTASPHYKARYHVIVDTDGGMDDLRAICMLLASEQIDVIAITCVDGVLAPDSTWARVTALLHHLGHEGISVGAGPATLTTPPQFRRFAGNLDWGCRGSLLFQSRYDAMDLIKQAVNLEDKPVDFLALGPLTNLHHALLRSPGLDTSIRKVVWYNKNHDLPATNYDLDPVAASMILDSELPVDIIGGGDARLESIGRFITGLEELNSVYAGTVRNLYVLNDIKDHFMGTTLADDLVPLYLNFPEAFVVESMDSNPGKSRITPLPVSGYQDSILVILDANREDKSIIFRSFPTDPAFFEADVKAVSDSIIERYGMKEWKIVVLTNEFHEHMGIWSVIGAKMGLRAREFFNVGIDELLITSLAGNQPPLSCMNDGLQVSTGATLGHGTISAITSDPSPAATFTFKNTMLELSLKESWRQQLSRDVGRGVEEYGPDSEAYWQYIRQLALSYWLELDRKDIFDIKTIPVDQE